MFVLVFFVRRDDFHEAQHSAAGSLDEAHLAWIGDRKLWARTSLEVIMAGVKLADQLIQFDGGFPDLEEQLTALTCTFYGALPVDWRVVSLVPGATAFELSGSDLQRSSNLAYTLPGKRESEENAGLDLFDGLLAFLLGLTLHSRLEILYALANPFSNLGTLPAPEQNHEDDRDHQQLRPQPMDSSINASPL